MYRTLVLATFIAIALPQPASANPAASANAQEIYSPATNTWKIDRKVPGLSESTLPCVSPVRDRAWRQRRWGMPLGLHSQRARTSADYRAGHLARHRRQRRWLEDRHRVDGRSRFRLSHLLHPVDERRRQSGQRPKPSTRESAEKLSRFPDLEFAPAGIPVVIWEDDRQGTSGMNVYISRRTGGVACLDHKRKSQ